MHQNINKPKGRARKTNYGLIFLPFLYDYCQVFIFFFCQDTNRTGSNCAIIGSNLSKKHKLALYKAQNGEPKFFFNILLGAICTKTWGQISKYYRAG